MAGVVVKILLNYWLQETIIENGAVDTAFQKLMKMIKAE